MTHDLSQLSLHQPYQGTDHITVGNGHSIPILHTGKGILPTPHHTFKLNKVLHTPIASNLVSVHKLTKDNNCTVTFDESSFIVQDKHTKDILHKGLNSHGLYHFHASKPFSAAAVPPSSFHSHNALCSSTTNKVSATVWLKRLGHPSSLKFNKLKQFLSSTCNKVKDDDFTCVHCCVAKSHRLPFKLSNATVQKPFSLIHIDVWGPFSPSLSGYKYYVLFVDEYSKFTWLYPLCYKSEVFDKFVEFTAYVDNQFSTHLQIFRIDGGTEFVNSSMTQFFNSHGILHQISCPYTPPQNGVSERKHRHITETAIALLHHSSIPIKYWFDAISAATYLINRMPKTKAPHSSPYELLFHKAPDYSFMRVFGCQCFPWLKPHTSHKLQPKSTLCVFFGYHPSYKGYRCLDPSSGKVYLSRHILFHENIFPFATISPPTSQTLSMLQSFFWSSSPSPTMDHQSFSDNSLPISPSL
ncbi:hypothetical protein CsSME_00019325 [Camellia sinensis var. sinensis]